MLILQHHLPRSSDVSSASRKSQQPLELLRKTSLVKNHKITYFLANIVHNIIFSSLLLFKHFGCDDFISLFVINWEIETQNYSWEFIEQRDEFFQVPARKSIWIWVADVGNVLTLLWKDFLTVSILLILLIKHSGFFNGTKKISVDPMQKLGCFDTIIKGLWLDHHH